MHVPQAVQRYLRQADIAAQRVEQARHVLGAQRLAVLVGEDVPRAEPGRIPGRALTVLCDLPRDECGAFAAIASNSIATPSNRASPV